MTAVRLQATIEERIRSLQTANAELLLAIEKAKEATRQKSAFLANMSHELLTPLSPIIGFAELLQGGVLGSLTEQQTRFLENILACGRYLLALINNLLDLAKIEAGELIIRPEVFPLPEAIEAMLSTIRPDADRKHQHIEVTVEAGLSWIKADPTRFRQIFSNLLSNAIKFTPAEGAIQIRSKIMPLAVTEIGHPALSSRLHSSKVVEIAITDTGIGIKPEELSRLFQRFTQLETTDVKRYRATCLGLVLTKSLIELHGGSIQAHSDGEGRGSTFIVRLPYDEPDRSLGHACAVD